MAKAAMTGYAAAKVATVAVTRKLGREVRFSGTAMYGRMRSGELRTVEVGGQTLVDGDALHEWMAAWCERSVKRTATGAVDYEAVADEYAL